MTPVATRFPTFKFSTLALTAGLAACGGGGSSSVATPSLDLSGVAATGAAMPGAAISAKCGTGTGSATTSTTGAYTISIANGSLPCVIRATSANGQTVLHSAIEGSGTGKVNVNVTPVSELIVSEAQGGSASAMFDQFDANKARLAQDSLTQAKDKIRVALASVTDLSGVDVIKDVLVAATGTNAGNALDGKLDVLRDTLIRANLGIAELATMIKDNRDLSVGEVVRVGLSQPSASCIGFRSGKYRLIMPSDTSQVNEIEFDAATLKATTPDGVVQLTANGCELAAADGTVLKFAKSGLAVMRTANGTLATLFPKQALTFADLTGNWNWVQRAKVASSTNYSVSWGETDFDATGKATADKKCVSLSTACSVTAAANLPQIQLQADGGFTMQGSTGQVFYGFRAPSGGLAVVGVSTDGSLMVARSGLSSVLPVVGDVHKRTDIGVSSTNVVDAAFFNSEYTIQSVDLVNKAFTRKRTSDCRVDTLKLFTPFTKGFTRDVGSSADCTTGTIAISELVGLNSQAMGVAAWVIPSSNFMGFSIATN